MPFDFKKTDLWQRTLAEVDNDNYTEARSLLRNTYLQMRDNTKFLVDAIPAACHALTVHNLSHLDALWEMADLIVGQDFPVNPLEAFVFGAAVLLHDAGMSIASYEGGLPEIQKTTEYKDSAQFIIRACLGNQGWVFLRMRFPPMATRIMALETSMRRS